MPDCLIRTAAALINTDLKLEKQSDSSSDTSSNISRNQILLIEKTVITRKEEELLETLQDLALPQRAHAINQHLYATIYDRITESSQNHLTENELKAIITEIIPNDVTKNLWLLRETSQLTNPISLSNLMCNITISAIRAINDIENVSSIILLHMNTHFAVRNSAHLRNQNILETLNNPTIYETLYNHNLNATK